MARATSAWLLLNAESLKPLRPGPLFEKFPLAGLGEAIPGTAEKIGGEKGEAALELEVSALYSDLDQNDHVNNTRYVRWFLDCYRPGEVASVEKLHFSINYLQAAAFNDRLRLRRCDSQTYSTVRGFFEDGTESFAARISRRGS
jgi:acyl-ACP thioesterase